MPALRHGWFGYPSLMVALASTSPGFHEHPYLMWGATVAFLVGLALQLSGPMLNSLLPDRYRQVRSFLRVSAVALTACTAGVVYSGAILFYGYQSWTFAIVLIWITGVAVAATVLHAPYLHLAFIHHGGVFVPPIVVSLWAASSQSYAFTFATCLYLVFLLLHSHRQYSFYWKRTGEP